MPAVLKLFLSIIIKPLAEKLPGKSCESGMHDIFLFTGVTINFVDSPNILQYFLIPVFQFVPSSETHLFPISVIPFCQSYENLCNTNFRLHGFN